MLKNLVLLCCLALLLGCQEELELNQLDGNEVLTTQPALSATTDVWLEAECAQTIGQAWEPGNDTQASQEAYLTVKAGYRNTASAPTNPEAIVRYNVTLSSAGAYSLFTRVRGPNSGSDSFWFRLDEGSWQMSGSTMNASFGWFSLLGSPQSLSSGSHTLELSYREDGVRIDKFLLSLSSTAPSGIGEPASNCSSSEPTTLQVNLADGNNTYTHAAWNHFNQSPNAGAQLTNLKDTQGQATGITLAVTSSGFTANNQGPQTGNDSGVVPDGVMKSYFYVSSTTDQSLRLSGLNPSARYRFTFYGGSSYSGDRTGVYSIGGESVSLNASGNTSQTVALNEVSPDANGIVVIKVRKAAGASYGFLNALIITANATSPPEGDDLPDGVPPMQLVRDYSFEDNIGRNVSEAQDNLKVHHLGRTDGRVEAIDGVGAYHFRITPGNYTVSDPSHRLELIPRNLPSPYFRQGWRAKWGQEYVYQIRVKLTNNYELGSEYSSIFNGKNDYDVPRVGCFAFQIEGDHYLVRQYYAREAGVGGKGTPKLKRYDRNGQPLTPGVDFDTKTLMGTGYASVAGDRETWVTWTVHVKWSYGNDGFFKLYKNNTLFHSDTGPNGYNDPDGPYVKFGLYNSFWKNGNRTGSVQKESYVDYFRLYVPK